MTIRSESHAKGDHNIDSIAMLMRARRSEKWKEQPMYVVQQGHLHVLDKLKLEVRIVSAAFGSCADPLHFVFRGVTYPCRIVWGRCQHSDIMRKNEAACKTQQPFETAILSEMNKY